MPFTWTASSVWPAIVLLMQLYFFTSVRNQGFSFICNNHNFFESHCCLSKNSLFYLGKRKNKKHMVFCCIFLSLCTAKHRKTFDINIFSPFLELVCPALTQIIVYWSRGRVSLGWFPQQRGPTDKTVAPSSIVLPSKCLAGQKSLYVSILTEMHLVNHCPSNAL